MLLLALVWVMTNNTQHRNMPGMAGGGWGMVAGGGRGMVRRGWGVVAGMGPVTVVDWVRGGSMPSETSAAKLDC